MWLLPTSRGMASVPFAQRCGIAGGDAHLPASLHHARATKSNVRTAKAAASHHQSCSRSRADKRLRNGMIVHAASSPGTERWTESPCLEPVKLTLVVRVDFALLFDHRVCKLAPLASCLASCTGSLPSAGEIPACRPQMPRISAPRVAFLGCFFALANEP